MHFLLLNSIFHEIVLMFIWSVRLLPDPRPLFSRKFALLLSWYIIFSFTVMPCGLKKILVQRTCGITSFATIAASVELHGWFNFCLLELQYIAPCPRIIMPPIWLYMSLWYEIEASIHHLIVCPPSHSKVKPISDALKQYLMMLPRYLKLLL